MRITVNITNLGTINMTGFPTLSEKGKQYLTESDETKVKNSNGSKREKRSSKKIEREEITLHESKSSMSESRKEKRSSKKIEKENLEEVKQQRGWGDLLSQIISSGEKRNETKDKTQEQRKKQSAVMMELVSAKENPRKKKADKKKEFVPTNYLSWTPFGNSSIVWEARGDEIDPALLKQYSLMPSMMVFYETEVAVFGTYQVDPPMLINGKAVFGQKYTIFVIDQSKRLEKRLKITSGDVAKIGHDVVVASGNHIVTEMSEGLAIYLKNLPPYHNEDIFYQNSYHYIKSIVVASFYD